MQKGRFAPVLWVAYLAAACQPSSNLPGRTGTGGHAGGGGGQVDASAQIDTAAGGSGGQAGIDGGAAGKDAAPVDVGDAGGTTQIACSDASAPTPANSCRSVAECGPIGPVKCCTAEPCWPGACPVPPSLCPTPSSMRLKCMGNQDCNPGGTCVFTASGCPQCQYSSCQYPPPPCTPSPDSCAPSYGRCQPDAGTCAPILCTEGYSCFDGYQCAVGSARADAHGCELIPCNAGWTCGINARCTAPSDPASHGCTFLTCKTDGDCDCGFCVNGSCSSGLGHCSFPPQ